MYLNVIENYSKIFRNLDFSYHFIIKSSIKLAKLKFFGLRKQSGKVNGKTILTREETNILLYEKLNSSMPFMAARIGGTELKYFLADELVKRNFRDEWPTDVLESGKRNSGIFPSTVENGKRFNEEYLKALPEADMLAYWGFILMEEYVIKHYAMNAQLFPSRAFEPFGFKKPWTAALEGKKILVIHPFEDTIISQYKNRDKLFKNSMILPEFELKTLKAVQSVANADCGYKDWFEALDYMYVEAMKKDFDIAILGCGAYGFPLAAKFKMAGKKAIHLGGFTQLLFGIKGARWEESRPDIVALYNEFWVRTGINNRPDGIQKMVDGPAYW